MACINTHTQNVSAADGRHSSADVNGITNGVEAHFIPHLELAVRCEELHFIRLYGRHGNWNAAKTERLGKHPTARPALSISCEDDNNWLKIDRVWIAPAGQIPHKGLQLRHCIHLLLGSDEM